MRPGRDLVIPDEHAADVAGGPGWSSSTVREGVRLTPSGRRSAHESSNDRERYTPGPPDLTSPTASFCPRYGLLTASVRRARAQFRVKFDHRDSLAGPGGRTGRRKPYRRRAATWYPS